MLNRSAAEVNSVFSGTPEEKRAAVIRATTEKNPLALKNFSEQGAAIQAKLVRIYNDPQYQKLTPAQKVAVRRGIYNKFVVPSFTAAGHQPPNIKTWLKGTKASNYDHFNMDDYFASTSINQLHDTISTAVKTAQNIVIAGLAYTHKQLVNEYTRADYFSGADIKPTVEKNKNKNQALINVVDRAQRWIQHSVDNTNFFLETHPREGMLANAGRFTGEQIVQLPLYEAIAGSIGAETLSKTLATTKTGQFVSRRLLNASEAVIAAKAQGKSNTEAAKDAVGFAVIGAAMEGAGTLGKKILSKNQTKKFSAEVIAQGGVPLAEELTNSAAAEMAGKSEKIKEFHPTILEQKTTHQGEAVEVRNKKEGTGYFVHEGQEHHYTNDAERKSVSATIDNKIKGRPEEFREFRPAVLTETPSHGGVTADIRNKLEGRGYFIHDGVEYHYNNPEERLARYEEIEKKIFTTRAAEDPVLHNTHEAEKTILDSMAQEEHGKDFKDLTPEQQEAITDARKVDHHEAADELPALVPDLNEAEVAHDNAKEAAENPEFAAVLADLKKMYPNDDVDKVVSANQVDSIKKQTGISGDGERLVRRIMRSRKLATRGEKKISEEAFASHRVDTLQYFRNPGTSSRAAARGVGKPRNIRTWHQQLAKETTAQFINTLKEADGDKIKFENPYHRMLFHRANRNELPDIIKDKLLRELKKEFPNKTAADFDKEADQVLIHLHALAKTGRLTSERNMFFSSKVLKGYSKWQIQLHGEVEGGEIALLRRLTANNPGGRKAMESGLILLQSQRFMAKNAEEWFKYDAAIASYIAQRGKIGGF